MFPAASTGIAPASQAWLMESSSLDGDPNTSFLNASGPKLRFTTLAPWSTTPTVTPAPEVDCQAAGAPIWASPHRLEKSGSFEARAGTATAVATTSPPATAANHLHRRAGMAPIVTRDVAEK